jgi:hypothetical protein
LSVKVNVSHRNPETGEPELLLTHLFSSFKIPDPSKGKRSGVPSYIGFRVDEDLRKILARSGRWGRIKAEIVCAMTSKYAIALYEMVQLRAGLDRCVEQFPVERFRELLGVPPGTYESGSNFVHRVLEVAAIEVNGLSEMGVKIEVVRQSPRAPITAVTMAWWRKEGDEFRAAVAERNRSKEGRMARLRGTVETATPLALAAE